MPVFNTIPWDSQVNADKYGDLGSRFDVKGFPTILYFGRGKPAVEHTTCVFLPYELIGRTSHSCSQVSNVCF